jgi:MerR family copper efflux transcriptional regulator
VQAAVMKELQVAENLSIGSLADRTGCTVPTIRYYEEIGLIPPAKRRASGHRFYDGEAQELLLFIRRCRDFGFPIEHVRELVVLSQSAERDCVETLNIAQQHLEAVRQKLAELRKLERSLAGFASACSAMCAGGPATDCSIVKDLAGTPSSKNCCG